MDQAKSDRERLAEIEDSSEPLRAKDYMFLIYHARLAIEAAAREPKPAESLVDRILSLWRSMPRDASATRARAVAAICEVQQWIREPLDAHRRSRGEDVEALKVALAKAEAERVRLRFAILAGEDVPGFAETVSTVECTELLAEERRRQRDRAEKAEAERDALREQVETAHGPRRAAQPEKPEPRPPIFPGKWIEEEPKG